MNDEQNWTGNKELADLIEELDSLVEKFAEIGESELAMTLQAVSSARVLDGDSPIGFLRTFRSAGNEIFRKILTSGKYMKNEEKSGWWVLKAWCYLLPMLLLFAVLLLISSWVHYFAEKVVCFAEDGVTKFHAKSKE